MFKNIPKEKVLEVVKLGPTLPAKIAKQVGGDTMLIGAILSTMIADGTVKYTSMKVGGSPLYYVPEDEKKLEEFTNHLNAKDQRTVALLKEKKVLQDSMQEPLIRVSLQAIKDFAKPFEADINGKKELCWRYMLVPLDDAKSAIPAQATPASTTVQAQPVSPAQPSPHEPVSKPQEIIVEQKEVIVPIPEAATEAATEIVTASSTTISIPKKRESRPKPAAADVSQGSKKDFLSAIKEHLHAKSLDVISVEKIKKSEYNIIVKDHDSNTYHYCKAKDKKTINEGDLSTAFVFAQSKKMPCMFLTTGHLTKKAESMVHKEFKDMVIETLQ